jgi:ubiquinol-cytochrome c reductase cytochrome b subunit
VSLLALPFIHTSPIRSSSFRPLHRKLFWLLVADCLLLGWIGCQPVEDPYVLIGQLASVYFFLYFLVFMPMLGKIEHYLLTQHK